ncbi:protein of unknown function [Marinobacter daqiaonensis]|uniref:DUF4124 domain-containing protein n=1 Tax=Marinobacter daqiaonensis TaxID=650891 RepID=A0A1I6JVA5_9GAMM|nr:DUF4124 domain-containing protein [Marinobacter daqiaonensis]SFR82919.1 protein of unknown function [Marinobacter daqiaonensis]
MQTVRLTTCLFLASCLLFASIADARMYRYQDSSGQMVISNTVPQEASTRGYEILNSQGRVIERVAPAPTEEELRQREAEKRRQQQAEEQRKQDRALLRRYSHPDDAVRALHRKIRELEGLNQLKRGNISVIESQLDAEHSRAANMERSGTDIPENMLLKIDRLERQIEDIEAEIAAQNAEIEILKERYLEDIERLEAITEHKRTLPLEPGGPQKTSNPQ